ncbi:MAG: branched-chain amino acid ABC transporter permease [Burkholderiaceae bacterium]|nr:branched-chain amino acid ABC transporter permease [Burkholderiaceae bacterium]
MAVLQLTIAGIATGCIYALIALGFVLIYKATEVVNFAQGDLMMLGAFVAFTFSSIWGWPFWAAVLAAIAVMTLFGAAFDRFLLRPIAGQPAFAAVMVTIGAGFAMRGIASMIPGWGTDTHALRTPYSDGAFRFGGLVIAANEIAIIAMTSLLCLVLWLFFKRTRIGIAMQASSQNQLAAYYMGIPVRRINTLIWGISAGVAAFAAVLLAPTHFVHTLLGFAGLKAFPAAVVGGFGSIPGAIVGGLIIGLVEAYSGFFFEEGWKDIAPYLVVLIVLVIRPSGIFSEMRRKKV